MMMTSACRSHAAGYNSEATTNKEKQKRQTQIKQKSNNNIAHCALEWNLQVNQK